MAGPVGGALAVIGVIICPITSGDTALRSTRMIIQDDRGYSSSDIRKSIIITGILIVPIVILCATDFTVLWNYFSWLNQTLACVMLWVATIFILAFNKNRWMAMFTAVPAMFMTMVVSAFILHSNIGLSLDYDISVMISVLVTVAVILVFVKYYLIDGKAKEID